MGAQKKGAAVHRPINSTTLDIATAMVHLNSAIKTIAETHPEDAPVRLAVLRNAQTVEAAVKRILDREEAAGRRNA